MKNLILFTLTLALLTSCASTEKMLEKGDYEGLIALATRKLAGSKKKDSYVSAVEIGFEKLTRENLAEIEKLKTKNTARDWERINELAKNMDRLQKMISPLLPLVSETGHRASFKFVNTNPIMSEANKNAADLHYIKLSALVTDANQGNKTAARTAVDLIDRINYLSSEYELTALKNEMIEAGINNIWVTIEDRSYARLPRAAEDDLYYMPIYNTQSSWNQFFTHIGEDFEPDYKVVFRIEDLRAEPALIRTVKNNYSKEIVDGWEYVLDARGNVTKDSLGNDIKKDRKIKVKASVIETIQTKKAYITGYMEVINMKTGNITYSRPMVFEDNFSQAGLDYFGDERALDKSQRTRIPLVNSPDDIAMMMNVANKAKNAFIYELKNCNYI